jgi:hypothetical protein
VSGARRLVGLVALGLALGGCARQREVDGGRPAPSCAEQAAPVVDPRLFAFLSKARATHHEADLAEDAGDRASAVRALERLVDGPVPGPALPPEAAEVLADARARLADLRSASGDFDGARRDVEAGLAVATDASHFRGHLLEVAGVVEERRGKVRKAAGDLPGAEAAFRLAIEQYERAIATQDEVIRRALGASGKRDAGPDGGR